MLSTLLLIASLVAPAQAASQCTADQVIGNGIVASRFQTVAYGCLVQITPRAKPNMLYREYWIDDRGRFMVFTSTPGDDVDRVTGTRTYFLFPRKQLPSIRGVAQGELAFTLPSGQTIGFSESDAKLSAFPGEFAEDKNINLENQGGLEIQSFDGIRLDAGWMIGSQTYKNPKGRSTFSDAHNQKCEIQNDEFFFYENMYYSEPNLRFPEDESLKKFLKSRCPNLDLTPLQVSGA